MKIEKRNDDLTKNPTIYEGKLIKYYPGALA